MSIGTQQVSGAMSIPSLAPEWDATAEGIEAWLGRLGRGGPVGSTTPAALRAMVVGTCPGVSTSSYMQHVVGIQTDLQLD